MSRKAGIWIAVVIAIVLAAPPGWLFWRSLTEEEAGPSVAAPAAPARELFHVSKPLHVVVEQQATGEPPQELEWLTRELRYLLRYGRMRVTPVMPHPEGTFTLRIEIVEAEASRRARVALAAPDAHIERQLEVELDVSNRLATVRSLIAQLQPFLGAVSTSADWGRAIGTDDPAAYQAFTRSATDLLGPDGRGFTQPPAAIGQRTRALERLESLVRRQPEFARAWAMLAIAYLSLSGEDEAALTRISEAAVKRALALEADLPDAYSARGLIALRRGEWAAAQEHFDAALQLDSNSVPALEGLACLWVDAGRSAAAVPMAERAVALQSRNIGARECLRYALLANAQAHAATGLDAPGKEDMAIARVAALASILSGDIDAARDALHRSARRGDSIAWVDALIRAARNRRHTPAALRAITRAANDGEIDAATEVLCGAALRQSDFVFNRMLRLQKQNEAVPLRILWLEQTQFLRKHPRFEDVISAAGLPAFWQDHGLPDVCANEPEVYGCSLKRTSF